MVGHALKLLQKITSLQIRYKKMHRIKCFDAFILVSKLTLHFAP